MSENQPYDLSPNVPHTAAEEASELRPVDSAAVKSGQPVMPPPKTAAEMEAAEEAALAAQAEAQDIRENRALASVAYMGPLVLVPLVFGRTSPFVRHHTNQGFLLFVAEIFVWASLQVLAIPALVIPPLPPLLGLLALVAWITFFVFSLRGLSGALCGVRSEIPIIGIHKVVE